LSNLQPLLSCTNCFKSTMPDHDFRILIAAFRDHNMALIGTEPPKLTAAPTRKKCGGKCKTWKSLAQFSERTVSPDGLAGQCRTCDAAATSEWRRTAVQKKGRSSRARAH
jgi:hypothetical protein